LERRADVVRDCLAVLRAPVLAFDAGTASGGAVSSLGRGRALEGQAGSRDQGGGGGDAARMGPLEVLEVNQRWREECDLDRDVAGRFDQALLAEEVAWKGYGG
jgi:hypothetical protein